MNVFLRYTNIIIWISNIFRYATSKNRELYLRLTASPRKRLYRNSLFGYTPSDLGLDTTNNSKVAIKVIELKNIDN